MMTPATYHRLVAVPTAEEFFQDNGSVRRAMLACMAVLHIVDHVVQSRSDVIDKASARRADEEVERIAKDLTERHMSFAVVRAYALASKHARIGLHRKFQPGFDSARAVDRPPAFAGRMVAGISFAGDTVGGITVRWSEHGHVNLTRALQTLLPVLEDEFPEITPDS